MDFKDTVYTLIESDTLFLDSVFALLLAVSRFFEMEGCQNITL